MSCGRLEKLFLAGASPAEASAHRASCPECASLGADLDRVESALSGLKAPVPSPALFAALREIPSMTVSCEGAGALIAVSVEGEISAADRRRLESHVSRCEACAAAFQALSMMRELAAPQPAPWLSTRLAASRPKKQSSARRGFWSPKGAIALAYAAAVVVMIAGFNPADLARKAGAELQDSMKPTVTGVRATLADRIGAFEESALRKLAIWKGRAGGYGRAALSNVIQLVMKTEPQRPPTRPRSGEGKGVRSEINNHYDEAGLVPARKEQDHG